MAEQNPRLLDFMSKCKLLQRNKRQAKNQQSRERPMAATAHMVYTGHAGRCSTMFVNHSTSHLDAALLEVCSFYLRSPVRAHPFRLPLHP